MSEAETKFGAEDAKRFDGTWAEGQGAVEFLVDRNAVADLAAVKTAEDAAAKQAAEAAALEAAEAEERSKNGGHLIGEVVKDGSVYVGVSPTTQRPMFMTLQHSGKIRGDFNDVTKKMETLVAHGHDDWQVSSSAEAQVVIQNLEKGALKNVFDRSGIGGEAYVMTSTPAPELELVKGKRLGTKDDLGREMCEPDQYVDTGRIDEGKVVVHSLKDGRKYNEHKFSTAHSVFCVRS